MHCFEDRTFSLHESLKFFVEMSKEGFNHNLANVGLERLLSSEPNAIVMNGDHLGER